MKRILFCVCLLVMAGGIVFAANTMKPRLQKVTLFGVATSFTDSVAYITDVQELEVYVMPNGFLADRSLYSLQFNNYLVAHQGREGMTCAIFFGKKRTRIEKRYQRVCKRIRQANDVVLYPLGTEHFRFEKEEWVDPVVTETIVEAPKTTDQKQKTKKKK